MCVCDFQWSNDKSRDGSDLQLSLVDVKKAYFYGVPDRNLNVRFPPGLRMPENMVGKLARCMYGTTAGDIWEACYADCLVKMLFTQSVASPFCFGEQQK